MLIAPFLKMMSLSFLLCQRAGSLQIFCGADAFEEIRQRGKRIWGRYERKRQVDYEAGRKRKAKEGEIEPGYKYLFHVLSYTH